MVHNFDKYEVESVTGGEVQSKRNIPSTHQRAWSVRDRHTFRVGRHGTGTECLPRVAGVEQAG